MSEDVRGRLVFSKSGRDKGKAFILTGISGQGHYLLADGRLRKIEKPKKKNPQHVQLTNRFSKEIRALLLAGKEPENHMIQHAIQQMLETAKMNGERRSSGNAER